MLHLAARTSSVIIQAPVVDYTTQMCAYIILQYYPMIRLLLYMQTCTHLSAASRCNAQSLEGCDQRVCAQAPNPGHSETAERHLSIEGFIPGDLVTGVHPSVGIVVVQYFKTSFLLQCNSYRNLEDTLRRWYLRYSACWYRHSTTHASID